MTDPPRTTSISHFIYARPIKSEYFLGQQPHENFFKQMRLRKRTRVYPVWKLLAPFGVPYEGKPISIYNYTLFSILIAVIHVLDIQHILDHFSL